jgi:glyoxylase-like metal-dependent hydrolase (beta-lactamase superfamily II)/8-oxo-dGTP pyrophosphatase MutT (NUDIX family)
LVSPITKAASVLLARGSGPAELFVVRRAESLRFLGGFLAFPGGKVSADDGDIPVPGAESPLHYVAAARELFEETGVLLARRADGSFPAANSVLPYLRRKMLEENLPFAQVLERLSLTLHGADFVPLGSLTTPPFVPVRFATSFFLCRLPSDQNAEIWPGELDWGEWANAASLLQRWTEGDCLIAPPSVQILQAVCNKPTAAIPSSLAPYFRARSPEQMPTIWFAPEVQLLPLRTQALPPSTHTNAYLVGRSPCYLLDPGPSGAEEQALLFAALDQRQAAGHPITAILLTHHHPDHIGAAAGCAERYRIPIHAHPLTAQKLEGKVPVTRLLRAGDRLELGTAPTGRSSWHLEAIHTPGHASGHLAFYEPHYRLLFAGDMVSTLSSVVIAPPDGDLAVYLDSLRRLQAYECRLLLPAHGSPTPRCREVIQEQLDHRWKREEQLLAALRTRPCRVSELAQELYRGLPPAMQQFAEWQVTAGLEKLRGEGRAAKMGSAEEPVWQAV